ncbi:sugar ABC transporter permease [Pseudolysinimonas kribbensis]
MADTVPAAVAAKAPRPRAPHPVRRRGSSSNSAGKFAMAFLAPAIVLLGALVVYPIFYTAIRSLFDARGSFNAGANYVDMFTQADTLGAILHNIIWVLVAPIVCTVLGLVFAVLSERVKWKTAFKLIVFMPMAISMLAAGVIFRSVFQENPKVGVANAIAVTVHDAFAPSSSYPGAQPRPNADIVKTDGAVRSKSAVQAGETVDFPLVAIQAGTFEKGDPVATKAPAAKATQITGTVWSDFVLGGGGTPNQLGDGKNSLIRVTVEALPAGSTKAAATALTDDHGRFTLSGLDPGTSYTVELPSSNFREPFNGVPWLGPQLINVVVILSYVWIWAGFCMVMVGSGLTAIDRSLLEAARTDGANEWQVFSRITVPQLAPVLVVILVTLIINVLKIFDLVYVIPPGTSKPAANVIAVQMWNVSFGGGNDQGLGSALSIFLLVLVLPAIILNVRRFRSQR